jgi:hypothetical protein
MQTPNSYGHLHETSAASALQYLSPFILVAGMGGSGIDTSQLLTSFDTEGYNSSLYAFTVRTLRAHCADCSACSLTTHRAVPPRTCRMTLGLQR